MTELKRGEDCFHCPALLACWQRGLSGRLREEVCDAAWDEFVRRVKEREARR